MVEVMLVMLLDGYVGNFLKCIITTYRNFRNWSDALHPLIGRMA